MNMNDNDDISMVTGVVKMTIEIDIFINSAKCSTICRDIFLQLISISGRQREEEETGISVSKVAIAQFGHEIV